MTQEEWGPWVEHDGKGFPEDLRDLWIETEWIWGGDRFGELDRSECVANPIGSGWYWSNAHFLKKWVSWNERLYERARILRYRIRKPRGMVILEKLIADLPGTVDA